MKLRDKVVLITGASKGIGRALALGLAAEGAHVVVNFHTDRDGVEATASMEDGRPQAKCRKAILGPSPKRTSNDRRRKKNDVRHGNWVLSEI